MVSAPRCRPGARGLLALLLLLPLPGARGLCGAPPRLSRARRQDTSCTEDCPIGTEVTYRCSDGFVKIPGKSDTVVCLSNSEWSNFGEFCNGGCGAPPRLKSATLSKEDGQKNYYPKGTTASYVCRPGYESTEVKPVITCLENLRWSEAPEFCIGKSCGVPKGPEHGRAVVLTNDLYGARANIICDEGFRLHGRPLTLCLLKGDQVEWRQLPTCQAITCSPPPNITNGIHNGSNVEIFVYNSSVTYKCDHNFLLIGEASIHCTTKDNINGVWNGSAPECKAQCVPPGRRRRDTNAKAVGEFCGRTCDSPPSLSFAELPGVVNNSYPVGTELKYSCRPGYVLGSGKSPLVTCLANSTWSVDPEFCVGIPCKQLELENGRVHLKDRQVGATANFSCDEGYRLIGPTSAQCVVAGNGVNWDKELPHCQGQCGAPPRLSRASPHDTSRTEGFPIGTEVTYRCRDGFVKIPGQSDTLVCLSNSEWSAIGEFCGASCGAPPRISSAVLSKEDEKKNYHPSGTTVSYVCRPGYESTELKPVITCLENLTWSEAPEFCRGKSCGVPKGPEHGRAVALTNDLYGARANIICDEGFRLHGRTFIQCMLKGDRVEWSQLPTCQVTITQDKPTTVPPEGTEVAGTSSGTCDSPPRLSFAELPGAVNNSYPVGTELKYSCRPGYILGSGKSPLVTCLDNSTWSVDPEFCVVIITQDKPTTILPEGAEIAGTSSDSALNTAGNSAEPESGGLGIDRRIGITGIGPGIDTCIIGIIIAVVIVILIVILIVLLIRIGNIGPGIDTCIICIIIAVVIVILIVLLIRIIYVGPGIDTYIICIIIAFVIVILFVLLIHIIYVALNKKRKKKKGSYGVNLDSPKYHIAPEDDLQMSETKSNLIIEV